MSWKVENIFVGQSLYIDVPNMTPVWRDLIISWLPTCCDQLSVGLQLSALFIVDLLWLAEGRTGQSAVEKHSDTEYQTLLRCIGRPWETGRCRRSCSRSRSMKWSRWRWCRRLSPGSARWTRLGWSKHPYF